MSDTEKFLQEAFAGESQANRKYASFAEMADKEGLHQAARLFRAAAEAEAVHAANHLRAMKAIKSTRDNLKEAVSGEDHEWEKMYPEMISAAEREGQKGAKMSFHFANEVEKIHSVLFGGMSAATDSQESYPYYVCPYCGNTVARQAPHACQVCGADGALFKKVE
ncbi:MAG: Rubrerythrin [Methanosaeta sp. PtaB.Bin039]|nr:MAG: Rubrerythrin [Methanosaeta sp. PtaB.Bin039]OPY44987.1 MAG: Rubrerythrin [Methanosaeta sp. PtaU1.Bin028]HOT07868.1 rubrerythrin family protein [Methanotrichaceae archaeon]HQF17639.1 rubrerythrin family protein [Methanotrichaceae archaeon]HQI92227.1 rubrerythrin family protein [Methanotrichaceae archaeon]